VSADRGKPGPYESGGKEKGVNADREKGSPHENGGKEKGVSVERGEGSLYENCWIGQRIVALRGLFMLCRLILFIEIFHRHGFVKMVQHMLMMCHRRYGSL
jgi:hypothetical protein